jgi:predicted ABC-type ATPase
MLSCREFVNADSIAAGLSPFNPESVAIEAARLMLSRIQELLESRWDFAFETTLATRSYVSLVKEAQEAGYKVTLLFMWLDSPATAVRRVAGRLPRVGIVFLWTSLNADTSGVLSTLLISIFLFVTDG